MQARERCMWHSSNGSHDEARCKESCLFSQKICTFEGYTLHPTVCHDKQQWLEMHHHRRFLPMQHIPSLSTQVAVVLLSQTISLHVPYQSVTSHCMSLTTPLPVKPATIRGKGPCSAFLGSMSGTSRRIRLLMSVSVLCAEKQNTFLYPVVFTGCSYFLLKKPLHGLSITIHKRNHK